MTIMKQIEAQNIEFDALTKLSEQWQRLQMTPVVDDDYPEVRHSYESALRTFLSAVVPRVPSTMNLADAIIEKVREEFNTASSSWPKFNSAHEAFSVLKEEVDELWTHVKTNQKRRRLDEMMKEAIQVAAMAVRFAHDVCDEQGGRK